MVQAVKRENALPYLLLLTAFFVLLELSFFIQTNKAYLIDFHFVANKITIPFSVVPAILLFTFVQLMLHVFYCLIVWRLALVLADYLHIPAQYFLYFNIGLWLLGVLTVLVANQFLYPNSKFSYLTAMVLFNPHLLKFCFILLLFIWAALISFVLSAFFYRNLLAFSLVIALSLFVNAYYRFKSPFAAAEEQPSLPNIILVGVDSLRPDFLSYYDKTKAQTPFIDSFLQHASIFAKSFTPLARTFPSWTGILTGEYPKQSGVRSNLVDQAQLNLADTLPNILRRQGYQTIYATDETRFSNIDKNYGFDKIITPPMGLNDFLLGTFNDFPLSNLVVNTRLGKWLFPYSYANRAVFFTYEPRSFLTLVRDYLNQRRDKPLFLAIHFCMPHHPYSWAEYTQRKPDIVGMYTASITRADLQLKRFFRLLAERHLLDHAIVVLLSDHGEALEIPGDRITQEKLFVTTSKAGSKPPKFYPPGLQDEGFDRSGGHGTDVLGLTQYHTLFAMRLYGMTQYQGAIDYPVTLLSIKPTVLDLLGRVDHGESVKAEKQLSLSLVNAVRYGQVPMQPQDIFIESDFSPAAIHTVFPQTREVVLEGVHIFRINPTTLRLTVKPEMMQMIIKSKQFADLYGDWVLAFYPQADQSKMPILVNLKTGQWTNDLSSTFARRSPAEHMLQALHQFYAIEL